MSRSASATLHSDNLEEKRRRGRKALRSLSGDSSRGGAAIRELEVALRELSAERFTSHMLLDRTPWLWQSRESYVEWKSDLASDLGVDPYSLLVVGSACIGATLNPKKQLFSSFHQGSDVDVAIVSAHHFELAWKTLRELGRKPGQIPTRTQKRMIKQHRDHLIFDGTIAANWFLGELPFGDTWADALLAAEHRLPSPGHEVKARIYRDVDDLRAYHVRNVRRLKAEVDVSDLPDDLDDGRPLRSDDILDESGA